MAPEEPPNAGISVEETIKLLEPAKALHLWLMDQCEKNGKSPELTAAACVNVLQAMAAEQAVSSAGLDPGTVTGEKLAEILGPAQQLGEWIIDTTKKAGHRQRDVSLACVLTLERFGVAGLKGSA